MTESELQLARASEVAYLNWLETMVNPEDINRPEIVEMLERLSDHRSQIEAAMVACAAKPSP
ncbi:MAG: hypothetical protein HC860_16220 [Alkalinema sp. RU_4_3]|nr:hypothetical protein [Alkalinema sp. RU_4_3]